MHKTRSRADRDEVELDEAVQRLTGKEPQTCPAREWSTLREHLRLAVLHPGRYVVYRDHFEGDDGTRCFVRREVLYQSRRLEAAQHFFDSLTPEQQREACLSFVENGDGRLRAR